MRFFKRFFANATDAVRSAHGVDSTANDHFPSAPEPIDHDVVRTLLCSVPRAGGEALAQQIKQLSSIVVDLLMEVEALRSSHPHCDKYRAAYRQTALLMHNSLGPSSGPEKLIRLFYAGSRGPNGRAWREGLMMHRLGFTSEDLERYEREAREAETYT